MKKNLLALAVVSVSVFATSAFAADGVVNFKGSITDQSCTVDTTSKNKEVVLGKVSKDAFTLGKTAGAKQFSLVLKDCPKTVSGATVRFDGTKVVGQAGLLELTAATDAATGVGVQLLDDQNNVINLGADSRIYTLVSTGDNTLDFMARYYAYAAVGTGSANATANFTVVYQ
ncbi:fimbrial protein [Serratia sp. PAMC26656]|uniref:fimbrial protein n=1 Tax=Serratia sp. PAMC26656 TaxID=2775909 RepID=UPI0018F588E2|nr:fimbrial protein [Serratia sp. PAMC26656]MBJ7892788.1 fimbrial protein [Serratia sp. PAMC26656]